MLYDEYKVVHLSYPTAQAIESTINNWSGQGWHFLRPEFPNKDICWLFFVKYAS